MLPATDLYLMGRDATHNAPRGLTVAHKLVENGVVCSVATNNVLNPFTPFGDASLLRMANFYANVAHAGISEFDACLDLVTELVPGLMNLGDYGIAPGNAADLVILDTDSGTTNAIAELPDLLMGFKNGSVFDGREPALFFMGQRIIKSSRGEPGHDEQGAVERRASLDDASRRTRNHAGHALPYALACRLTSTTNHCCCGSTTTTSPGAGNNEKSHRHTKRRENPRLRCRLAQLPLPSRS